MKADSKTKIDGTEYVLRAMNTSTGARTLVKIGRLILPTKQIISIFDAKKEFFGLMDANVEDVVAAIGNCLHEDEMMEVVETVLEPLSIIEKTGVIELKAVYNTHFAGNYDHLFKVFFIALRHNYSSFFVGLPGIVGSVLGTEKASTPGKSTSTP